MPLTAETLPDAETVANKGCRMLYSCPISSIKVDESAVRINSLLVAIGSMTAILSESGLIAMMFLVDFGLKCVNPAASPLSLVSKFLAKTVKAPRMLVDYAPKRFAASIGVLLFAASIFSLSLGLATLFTALLFVVMFCAILEGAFAYCVGCKVYALFISLRR